MKGKRLQVGEKVWVEGRIEATNTYPPMVKVNGAWYWKREVFRHPPTGRTRRKQP